VGQHWQLLFTGIGVNIFSPEEMFIHSGCACPQRRINSSLRLSVVLRCISFSNGILVVYPAICVVSMHRSKREISIGEQTFIENSFEIVQNSHSHSAASSVIPANYGNSEILSKIDQNSLARK